MKSIIFSFLLIISLSACRKYCDQSLLIGEIVQIPVEFVGFSSNEVNNITVYKINKLNPAGYNTVFTSWLFLGWESASFQLNLCYGKLFGFDTATKANTGPVT
jgi:hypothetical protein